MVTQHRSHVLTRVARQFVIQAEQRLRGNDQLRRLARDWRNRFPGATLAARRLVWKRGRDGEIRAYFAEHPTAKVQFGTGPYARHGWLNTDLEPASPGVVFVDATERLPFPTASVDYIYAEHMIEHISHAEGLRFLRECTRVMKPGAKVRLATPNLLNILKIYQAPNDETREYLNIAQYRDLPAAEARRCAVLNHFVRSWGHQFIYDPDTLRSTLEAAGLTNVRFWDVGESDDPTLRNLESHGHHIGEWNNRFETMVAEAVRPAR